jgi:hypothetical protein
MKKRENSSKLLAFFSLALFALMSIYTPAAGAYSNNLTLNKSTCLNPLGGIWSGSTCTIKNYIIDSTTDLSVPPSTWLRVRGTLTISGELDNSGNVTDVHKIIVGSGGYMLNENAAEVRVNSNGTINVNGGGYFDNNGYILNNNMITVNGNFTNGNSGVTTDHGTIQVKSGGKAVNAGILLLSYGGVMSVSNVFNNTGTGTVYDFSHIMVFGGGTINNKAGGLFVLFKEGSILVNLNAIFNNAGIITSSGADGGDNAIVNAGAFSNSGTILTNGGFTNQKLGTLANSGTLRNRGTFKNWGTFSNSGLMTNPGNTYSQGTITNSGNITSAGYFLNNGKFDTVASGFVFNYGVMSNHLNMNNNGTLTNAGTLLNPGIFTNYGKVDNTAGIFDNAGPTNNVGDAATISIQQNASFLNRIGGTLNIFGGSVTNSGALFNRGTTTVASGAILTNNGVIFNPTYRNLDILGTFNGSGIVLPWD